jgi:D-ribose pyranase
VKKIGIINSSLSAVVAALGHTDTLTIADAGLPIPSTTTRIDLALTDGIPAFLDTLKVVLSEIHIEKAIVADEILSVSPAMHEEIKKIIAEVPIETVPHSEFKRMTESTRAVVRTGEHTPYANIILVSGAWGFDA